MMSGYWEVGGLGCQGTGRLEYYNVRVLGGWRTMMSGYREVGVL